MTTAKKKMFAILLLSSLLLESRAMLLKTKDRAIYQPASDEGLHGKYFDYFIIDFGCRFFPLS